MKWITLILLLVSSLLKGFHLLRQTDECLISWCVSGRKNSLWIVGVVQNVSVRKEKISCSSLHALLYTWCNQCFVCLFVLFCFNILLLLFLLVWVFTIWSFCLYTCFFSFCVCMWIFENIKKNKTKQNKNRQIWWVNDGDQCNFLIVLCVMWMVKIIIIIIIIY